MYAQTLAFVCVLREMPENEAIKFLCMNCIRIITTTIHNGLNAIIMTIAIPI